MPHTSPMQPFDSAQGSGEDTQGHYHWHLEFIPMTTNIAGFERGTEIYINVVAPETAADALRR